MAKFDMGVPLANYKMITLFIFTICLYTRKLWSNALTNSNNKLAFYETVGTLDVLIVPEQNAGFL